jgi:hypothetical protein
VFEDFVHGAVRMRKHVFRRGSRESYGPAPVRVRHRRHPPRLL